MNLKDYKVTVDFTSVNPHTKISGAIVDTIFAKFGRSLIERFKHLLTSEFDEVHRVHRISLSLYVLPEDVVKEIEEAEEGVKELLKGLEPNVKKSR